MTALLQRIEERRADPRDQRQAPPLQEWRRRALEQRDRLGNVAVVDRTGTVAA
ncbi:MAG TPA: hypothetical protein VEW95_09360 [Candidatus Limnocylindrales bacterium]|nr:hypothetical protein [Candidatus Limnocylindrales bacterium]